MKFGSFEGTNEEFDNVCINHGFKPDQFLATKDHKITNPILWVSTGSYAVLIFLLYKFGHIKDWSILLFIFSAILLIIVTLCVQLRFKDYFATTLALVIGGVLLGVALGNLTPQQAAKKIQEIKIDK